MGQTKVKRESRILEESLSGMASGSGERERSQTELQRKHQTVETLGIPFSDHHAIKIESTNKTKKKKKKEGPRI